MYSHCIRFVASAALVLCLFSIGSAAHASTLTQTQISAIVGLLQSFGADQAVIANVTQALGGQSTSQSACVDLPRTLTLGSTGKDVTNLQNYLKGNYLPTSSTDYYGFLTAKAVGELQLDLGVLSSTNDPAYGIMGPKTRSMITCRGADVATSPRILTQPETPQVSSPTEVLSATLDQSSVVSVGSSVTLSGSVSANTATIAALALQSTYAGGTDYLSLSNLIKSGGDKAFNLGYDTGAIRNGTWSATIRFATPPVGPYKVILYGCAKSTSCEPQLLATKLITITGGTQTNQTPVTLTPSTLQTQEVRVGTGKEAHNGSAVTVSYTLALADGTVVDSSAKHGQSFAFTLGGGQVIAGFDQGVLGMKEGGRRILTIPPSLGYGAGAVGPIPANSTLTFDVTLEAVGS